MNEENVLSAFAALSNRMRLRVVKQLVEAGAEGMIAGEVAEALNASPSRTSFHLAALHEAGLVTSERKSRQIVYRVSFEAMGALTRFLLQDCCKGNPTVRACCVEDRCC